MNKDLKRFSLRLLFLTFFFAIGLVVTGIFLGEYYFRMMPVVLLFFSGLTWVTFKWLVRAASRDFAKFTRTNMLVTFLRLVVYIIVFILCLSLSSTGPVVSLIFIGMLYFSFSAFEIYHLSKYLRIKQ
jgi:hypothetical protein